MIHFLDVTTLRDPLHWELKKINHSTRSRDKPLTIGTVGKYLTSERSLVNKCDKNDHFKYSKKFVAGPKNAVRKQFSFLNL